MLYSCESVSLAFSCHHLWLCSIIVMIQLHILPTDGTNRHSLGKSESPWLNNNVITYLSQSGWLWAQTAPFCKLEKAPLLLADNEKISKDARAWLGKWSLAPLGPLCSPQQSVPEQAQPAQLHPKTLISTLKTIDVALVVAPVLPFYGWSRDRESISNFLHISQALHPHTKTLQALDFEKNHISKFYSVSFLHIYHQ